MPMRQIMSPHSTLPLARGRSQHCAAVRLPYLPAASCRWTKTPDACPGSWSAGSCVQWPRLAGQSLPTHSPPLWGSPWGSWWSVGSHTASTNIDTFLRQEELTLRVKWTTVIICYLFTFFNITAWSWIKLISVMVVVVVVMTNMMIIIIIIITIIIIIIIATVTSFVSLVKCEVVIAKSQIPTILGIFENKHSASCFAAAGYSRENYSSLALHPHCYNHRSMLNILRNKCNKCRFMSVLML